MRWSIRYQLLVPILTLLLGVVGLSTWAGIGAVQRERRQIETQVRNVAHTLSDFPWPMTGRILQDMKGLSGAEYLLTAADGQRTASLDMDQADVDRIDLSAVGEPARDWETLHLGRPVQIGGVTYLGSGVRLGKWPNTGSTLYILYPESLWHGALWAAIRPALTLGLFGAIASIALALGVAQRLGKRVQELERRTRQIAGGDFSPMPLPGGNDELRDLGQSVNEMAQQLSQLQETIRQSERLRLLGQMSGGLAHQLRNDVAGARLAVQLHARECDATTDREALDVALRQLSLIETHVKRFLALGRREEARHEVCSLRALLDQAITLIRPQCKHAGIDLSWQSDQAPFPVLGDPDQLGHVFLNVIHNAIEAAGPGGWVKVALTQKGDGGKSDELAVIEVSDSGGGPPEAITDRLFEPFVTGKPEGVGLGLAVARQVMEEHGGRIAWTRRNDQTCFRLELPLRPDLSSATITSETRPANPVPQGAEGRGTESHPGSR